MGFFTYLFAGIFGFLFIKTRDKGHFVARIIGFPFMLLGFSNPVSQPTIFPILRLP